MVRCHLCSSGRLNVSEVPDSYIESFNGRLRDECLNVEVFLDLGDARRKLDKWRNDYNQQRPHSALADRTPDEFASVAMQRTSPKRPFVLRGSSELL
jgi:transposase InsO family protein